MTEPSPDAPTAEPPWLAIAVVLAALAALTVAVLGTAQPPSAPPAPSVVQQPTVDLGDWDPFAADVGGTARDAGSAPVDAGKD